MNSIGVTELKRNTSRVLRRLRDQREIMEVTVRGEVVALLVPAPNSKPASATLDEAVWTDLEQLAVEIGAHWPKDVSAVDAIRDDRERI